MMSTGTRRTTSHKKPPPHLPNERTTIADPGSENSPAERKKQDDHRLPRPVRKRMHVLGDPFRESKKHCATNPRQAKKKKGFSAD